MQTVDYRNPSHYYLTFSGCKTKPTKYFGYWKRFAVKGFIFNSLFHLIL